MQTAHTPALSQPLATLADAVQLAAASTFGAISGAEPAFLGPAIDRPCNGLVGVISYIGDIAWSLRLGLPRETAVPLALKFAGFDIDYDSDDMSDVVGELANVLAGDVVAQLQQHGIDAQMSLPAVVRGTDLSLPLPDGQSAARLWFASEEGHFWLTIVTTSLDFDDLARQEERRSMPLTYTEPQGSLILTLGDSVKDAVLETFGAFLDPAPTYHGPSIRGACYTGIAGIISLVGEACWSLMLAFPPATAIPLAQKFAGFEIDFASPDMGDVIGELANVLAGDVSARLDTRGIKVQLSLPTITRGTDLQFPLLQGQTALRMDFSTADGPFWLMIAAANPGQS